MMRAFPSALLACTATASMWAQTAVNTRRNLPRFEDYAVTDNWKGTPAPLQLTRSSERMFSTKLKQGAKQPADFAGHYTMVYWMCGSNCSAAALIDLKTGSVYQPPLATRDATGWNRWIMCPGSFEESGEEFHADSRLMIVRCGMNFSESLQKNIPETWYFVWEQTRFRELVHISGKTPAEKPASAAR